MEQFLLPDWSHHLSTAYCLLFGSNCFLKEKAPGDRSGLTHSLRFWRLSVLPVQQPGHNYIWLKLHDQPPLQSLSTQPIPVLFVPLHIKEPPLPRHEESNFFRYGLLLSERNYPNRQAEVKSIISLLFSLFSYFIFLFYYQW